MAIQITVLHDPDRGPSDYRLAWLAADSDGYPVGSAFLRVFTGPGRDHLAELSVQVHPAERRAGTGARLLDAATDAAREIGRRRIITDSVDVGSAGERFCIARGLRPALTLTFTRLPLAGVDLAAMTALVEQPHPGYRLIAWDGVVGDDRVAAFAASRRAMDDMPMDDLDYGTETWDVQRVRSIAEAVGQRGDILETVAVTDESNDAIVGFTELVVPGDRRSDAQHYGTGVLPEHRGRGLARWMKAAAIRQARTRYPDLGGLLTDTADSNVRMRRINDELGYAPTHRSRMYQLDV